LPDGFGVFIPVTICTAISSRCSVFVSAGMETGNPSPKDRIWTRETSLWPALRSQAIASRLCSPLAGDGDSSSVAYSLASWRHCEDNGKQYPNSQPTNNSDGRQQF